VTSLCKALCSIPLHIAQHRARVRQEAKRGALLLVFDRFLAFLQTCLSSTILKIKKNSDLIANNGQQ
jgi:hypothetical protein